jgi:hypothetical protein
MKVTRLHSSTDALGWCSHGWSGRSGNWNIIRVLWNGRVRPSPTRLRYRIRNVSMGQRVQVLARTIAGSAITFAFFLAVGSGIRCESPRVNPYQGLAARMGGRVPVRIDDTKQ